MAPANIYKYVRISVGKQNNTNYLDDVNGANAIIKWMFHIIVFRMPFLDGFVQGRFHFHPNRTTLHQKESCTAIASSLCLYVDN